MRFKITAIIVAAAMLAACESTPENKGQGAGTGTTTAPAAAQTATATTTTPAPRGPVPGSQMDLEINVGDRVFYDFDKYNLKPDARTQVERWAAWLKTYPSVRVTIEGHADERGTREYNLALGERRANAAMEYLVSLGINANRIKTTSFGKERPAVLGSNERAWAQNRRAVAVVVQ
ncbi:MAG: peptidoglycan-associated lipoprotein Pal [Alphaproteobacteria bacterium]|nr:peptidoglycan-associated lipoprotein Pal [Alphaproteobacteria bacterium]